MRKRLSKCVVVCLVAIVIQGFFLFNAAAKEDIPIVTYDNNLNLVCDNNINMFSFKSLLEKQSNEQSIIIKNKSNMKIDFYFQLLNDLKTRYPCNKKKNSKQNDVYVQLKNNDKIIYKKNVNDFLYDVKVNKNVRIVTLHPNEEAKITINILPKNLMNDDVIEPSSIYRIVAMRDDAVVSVLDNNMRTKDISQGKILIKGSKNTPYFLKSMVYVSIAFVVIVGFITFYVFYSDKYKFRKK